MVQSAQDRMADNGAGGPAASEAKAPKKSGKKPRKAAAGQKEMLMPIAGKKTAKKGAAKKPAAMARRKSA
jgi:DNA end-binding protein Ku